MKNTNLSLIQLLFISLLISFILSCNKEDEGRTFETELAELNTFLREREAEGHVVDTTDLGVYYIKYATGTGPYPQAGDTCFLEYFAFHPDGTLFDATRDYANRTWEFIYLYQNLSIGLNEGIGMMNKGTFMDIIIPSHLAYGSQGTKQVPPYTSVIYRSKMHDIKFREETEEEQ